jgi:hypothetical protein
LAGGIGAAGVGMPPAAAFLRPSLLASRRNGEGPAGGGVEGIAIPGMGRRVAAVGTEPADDEVGALWGSAPARSATFGWPATDSLGLPDSPNESDSLRVAWDSLARAVLGRVSASLAGPAAGGATAASGVTATLAVGGTAAFAAGTSGPALAASGGTAGATSGWALYTWGGIGAAFGAGVDGISDTATGGTFGSAAGRALTCGPGGTWALGGGSLTSRTGDFFASPAGGAVATTFAAAAVGTSRLGAGGTFTSGAGRGR